MDRADVLEVLRAARARISDPSRWVQRHAATDANGVGVIAVSKRACHWCALGALDVEAGGVYRLYDEADLFLQRVGDLHEDDSIDEPPLGLFNDTHTHAEVLDLFDRAIAEMEATNG